MVAPNGHFEDFQKQLLTACPKFFSGAGDESDVVVSTRTRIARNLARFPFLTVADTRTCGEIEAYLSGKLQRLQIREKLVYLKLHELEPLDRLFLVERHLISRDHANSTMPRGVAISEEQSISIMVNEEDHLRIQIIKAGFDPVQTYGELERVSNAIETEMNFAFHPRYGFVTCCPTNLGTGLRVSVLIHLPAVTLANQVEKVLQSFGRIRFAVRGLFGEGTSPSAHLFQISNQVTLGKSESETIAEFKEAIPHIIGLEREWRRRLIGTQRAKIEDKVCRAFAILKNARILNTEETLECLSWVRLGTATNLISVNPAILDEIFILIQPSHLQRFTGRVMDTSERDIARATLVRQKLKDVHVHI